MNRADRQAWFDVLSRRVLETATAAGLKPRPGLPPRLPKYRNRVTVVDGVRFASELEADRYRELRALRSAGIVAWFIRQVPFDIPGGRYLADFLVVYADGHVEIEEVKGLMTTTAHLKIAAVNERFGIKIRILRRGDISR